MSINRGMDKEDRYIYTMEYYSAIKRNEILIHATKSIDFKNMMLNEKRQPQKTTYGRFYFHEASRSDRSREKVD